MTARQVSVSVSVVVPEGDAQRAAFALTQAMVDALPAASQGSVSIVVLEDDDQVDDDLEGAGQ